MKNGAGRALILAGAVAKGAFEAGVVRELARQGIEFERFVGTSAGALSATLLAVGASVGRFNEAAYEVERLWRDRANIWSFLDPGVSLLGVSKTRRLEKLVVRAIERITAGADLRSSEQTKVTLTVVATNLSGRRVGDQVTHEKAFAFGARDLRARSMWPEIARAAAASAAFPGLFIPPAGHCGPQIDGGLVNNAPISYVLDEGPQPSMIVVVTAEPTVPRPAPATIVGLLGRIIEIAINERIARDIIVANKRDEHVAKMETAVAEANLNAEQRERIWKAFPWRRLNIVTVRPSHDLNGGSFGGFFWPPYRACQIEHGEQRAAEMAEVLRSEPATPAGEVAVRPPLRAAK